MKKRILCACLLVLLVSGCERFIRGTIPDCHTPPPSATCTGSPNELTINTRANHLQASPPTVCAAAGTTIAVKIVPTPSNVTVITAPKNSADGWIFASNVANPDAMQIHVPEETPAGYYEYLIVASNGKCLDPRIRVP